MAIDIKNLKRQFVLDRKDNPITLEDPNSDFTMDEVIDFYSTSYPELINSSYTSEEKNGYVVYTFKSIAGTKG